jgi:hypothetical protein
MLRRPRTFLLALLVATAGSLAATSVTQAATLVLPDGSQAPKRFTTWTAQVKMPTAPGTIGLRLDGEGCNAVACASPAPATIWFTPRADREDFVHELGHHFDYSVMTDQARAGFQHIMGLDGRAWRSAPNSPHEKFAEAYRMCSNSPGSPDLTRWGYGYQPTTAQHRRVCALIRRTAGGAAAKPAQRTAKRADGGLTVAAVALDS